MNAKIPKRPDWDSYAEELIRTAQEEGLFDNLPGFGQPIPGIDEPHDELWWVREKLKREKLNALPPALAIRLDIEQTLVGLPAIGDERLVRRELLELNERIRIAQRNAVWGPSCDVMPLDIETVIATWRGQERTGS
jgi:DnaJ-like protein